MRWYITSEKTNYTIQVDAKHITDECRSHKKKKLSYADVLREGKEVNSPKIESMTTEILQVTQNEGIIFDLAAIRSVLLTDENCSSTKFETFP